ncbi:MAG: hypothetical protein QXH10_00780 [Ignisphaera sp.]|uniref:Uncharacterized protein n=1 Tax=Ignisphaera aggregans TaxID=334771 RepID=A0A7C4NLN4_9CREN
MKIYRYRKGVSTAIVSFVLSIVILAIFTYIFINVSTSTFTRSLGFRNIVKYSQLHEIAQIVLNKSSNRVFLTNIGSSDIILDQIIVKISADSVEARSAQDVCNSYIIPAFESIECNPSYEYIAVITVDGVILYPKIPEQRTYLVTVNTTYIIPITFSIRNPEYLREEFGVPLQLIAKPYTKDRANINFMGIKSDKLLLLPPGQESEFENAIVKTDSDGVAFGVVAIGYDPSWVIEKMSSPNEFIPPRFIIMIGGPGFTGNEYIEINNRRYTLTGAGYRILINNFTGVIQIKRGNNVIACSSTSLNMCSGVGLPALGFWYYGSTDSDLNLRLYLNGNATYIAKFMRIASGNSPTGESSYYPYLFIGDIDGNGLNDLVFITEDALYGSSNKINDSYGNDDLSDWSTTPLILKLLHVGRTLGSPDGSIDGRIYAGLTLYINIFFHDNSHPDENQLQDIDRTDWILRILLIDEYNSTYVIREYRYQEICNYHKTYISDFGRDNYFAKISQSIYINIPTTRRYWVAVAFQDSYRSGRTNDADFTVGIEFIGVIPFYR